MAETYTSKDVQQATGISGGLFRAWIARGYFNSHLPPVGPGRERTFPIEVVYEAALLREFSLFGEKNLESAKLHIADALEKHSRGECPRAIVFVPQEPGAYRWLPSQERVGRITLDELLDYPVDRPSDSQLSNEMPSNMGVIDIHKVIRDVKERLPKRWRRRPK